MKIESGVSKKGGFLRLSIHKIDRNSSTIEKLFDIPMQSYICERLSQTYEIQNTVDDSILFSFGDHSGGTSGDVGQQMHSNFTFLWR